MHTTGWHILQGLLPSWFPENPWLFMYMQPILTGAAEM